jgi:hypothetical protein
MARVIGHDKVPCVVIAPSQKLLSSKFYGPEYRVSIGT